MSVKNENLSCFYMIYGPPAEGLPWISICIGPDKKVFSTEISETLHIAMQSMATQVDVFIEQVQNLPAPRVWRVKLAGS